MCVQPHFYVNVFFFFKYHLISSLSLTHLSNLYYLNNFAAPEMGHGKDAPLTYREAVNQVHCL